MTATYAAGVCDRCGELYSARNVSVMLCPSCYLGAMEPAERGRLLGFIEKTGRRS
jgi:hypothetical protein